MLSQENLVKIFKRVKTVDTFYFPLARLVHELILKDKNVKIISKEWYDSFKQKYPDIYPLDLTDWDKVWRTFDGLIRMTFTYSSNSFIICEVSVKDGDFYGHATNTRCIFKVEIPISFIKNIEDNLVYAIEKEAGEKYAERLKAREEAFIKKFMADVLNKK